MIAITRLILENFQSHKYTSMDFDKGLNIIIGPTDSGKTSIFRAIKWALYNEPQGDFFIREGEREVSVTVEFNNGVKVKRYRTPSINGYDLEVNGEVQKYQGFGTGVPLEIRQATGMDKISFSPRVDRTINMAEQLDPPFLLSESPSTKAGAIGKLVNADIIDRALSNTNLDLRRTRDNKKGIDQRIEAVNEQLKSYEYLDDLEKNLNALEKIITEINDLKSRKNHLEKLSQNLKEIKNKKQKESKVLSATKDVGLLEDKIKDLEKYTARQNRYNDLFQRQTTITSRTKDLQTVLNQLKSTDSIGQILEEGQRLNYRSENLKRLNSRKRSNIKSQNTERNIVKGLKDINNVETNITQITDELKNLSRYTQINQNLKVLKSRINKGHSVVKRLEDATKTKNILNTLEKEYKTLDRYKDIYKSYTDTQKRKSELKNLHREQENLKQKLSKQYKGLLENMGVCPTCNRPFSEHDIETLVEEL